MAMDIHTLLSMIALDDLLDANVVYVLVVVVALLWRMLHRKSKDPLPQDKIPIPFTGRGVSSSPVGNTQNTVRTSPTLPSVQPTANAQPVPIISPRPLSPSQHGMGTTALERAQGAIRGTKREAVQGIVWAQILGPPRAYRPYNGRIPK